MGCIPAYAGKRVRTSFRVGRRRYSMAIESIISPSSLAIRGCRDPKFATRDDRPSIRSLLIRIIVPKGWGMMLLLLLAHKEVWVRHLIGEKVEYFDEGNTDPKLVSVSR